MKLVKHRFEKNGLVVDIAWHSKPWKKRAYKCMKGGNSFGWWHHDAFFEQDHCLDDLTCVDLHRSVLKIRKQMYDLSSRPITEEKDEACMR